ncbi:GAF domain-containing hybrid sensor histidine kinase/response regulator [Oceanicoccus sp. KOV_DT_Chl]|uniref:GAF domain-containing hybrid sensor histidine kinase/response regulator n=1 Tax=Oceanicoccus sp. KOV_DT_Chl TaxID=1904639 RepID=UPI000C7B6592|nr:GAF domain-containing hybrid sensor histidine kinase/response regulator [Oceanicoccus sp. KOV_DT_Chl]
MATDITEQKKTELELLSTQNRLEKTNEELSSALIRLENLREFQKTLIRLASAESLVQGDVDTFSRQVCIEAARVLSVERASVWLFEQEQTAIDLVCLYETEGARFTTEGKLFQKDFPVYFKALVEGRAIDADDVYTDPRTSEFAPTYLPANNVKSMLDAAIRVAGKIVGVICNEQTGRQRQWSPEDISYAGELADQIAQAIANQNKIRAERREREARSADQAKSELLATISHEIRTPMNGVLGMVELLRETILSDQQEEYLNTIDTSGNLLLTIINDVLEFSKLNSSELLLIESDVNVIELFSSTLALLRKTLPHQVELALDYAPGFYPILRFDNHRVRQILINLLGNAIKFTEVGKITVSFGLHSQNQWYFEVKDTGSGVESNLLKEMFEPFKQIDAKVKNPKAQGTGLGLSIVKKLVQQMKGEIKVSSIVGEGTTIRIELPLVHTDNDTADDESVVNKERADFGHLRVIAADDNDVNRKVILALLKLYGINADSCTNGQEVLDLFAKKGGQYDLILMDCDMPIVDGYQATEYLRSNYPQLNQPLIVALTAHAMDDARGRAMSAGMNDYLTKPIRRSDIEKLLGSIKIPG